MDPTLRCIRCGEPIRADDREDGEGPTCARCAVEGATPGAPEETPGPAPAAVEDPSPGFIPFHPPGPTDRMLTRSMLLPLPGMQAGPPDALIGRLEPRSLRWIELSDALRRFPGRDREQLLDQNILQDIHADVRALAEEELPRDVTRSSAGSARGTWAASTRRMIAIWRPSSS